MLLHPCVQCRRHVADSDAACPFCDAARARPARPRARPLVGRISRAAVFAGLTACWTSSKPTAAEPAPGDPQVVDKVTPGEPGMLSGVITDGNGAPLPSATVELHDANGKVAAVNTNERGAYHFNVPTGDYQLVLEYAGDDRGGTAQKPVTVRATTQLDVALPLWVRAPTPMPYGAPPARRRVV